MFRVEVIVFEKAEEYLVGMIIVVTTKKNHIGINWCPAVRQKKVESFLIFSSTVFPTSQTFTGSSATSSGMARLSKIGVRIHCCQQWGGGVKVFCYKS
jgi:hypothetical protein